MAEVDRISFLPEDIKISILSRLVVKEAVRTSSLARSWRHTWTLLPSLRLGRHLDRLGDDSKDFDRLPVSYTWIERVNHLVSSLQGPFLLFELSLLFGIVPSNLLQSLLDLLGNKGGVQTLHLSFYYSDTVTETIPFYRNLFRLRLRPYPSHKVKVRLPPFRSLKVLHLEGCQLVLPNEFPGFHSLTTLSLLNVIISNHHLHLLLATSKNLTTFKFVARDLDLVPHLSLNISLPFLTNVEFGINETVDKICLVSTPRLEQAYIFVTNIDSGSEKVARAILDLLTGVSMVSSLHLDCDVLELLCFSKQTEGVANLMRELLVKKQNGISCLDQTLKRVTVSMYLLLRKVMTGITLVKFFLLNAKVLKVMNIIYSDDDEE